MRYPWTVLSADLLVTAVWEARGTDLVLASGATPLMCVDGRLRPVPGTSPLDETNALGLLAQLISRDQMKEFARTNAYVFSFPWNGRARIDGRASRDHGIVSIALRIVPVA